MNPRLTAKLVLLALSAILPARAQEHVRLMPQLGLRSASAIAVSPDSRFVLTGGDSARLWDAATARQLQIFPGDAASVAFSPDSRLALIGGGGSLGKSETSVRLWEIATGTLLRTFSGPTDAITFVAFSRDATRIYAGSRDGRAILWDAATGKQLSALDDSSSNHSTAVVDDKVPLAFQMPAANTQVAVSPDGRFVLTGLYNITAGNKDSVNLWDAATGHRLRTLPNPSDLAVAAVAFSPDSRIALAAGNNFSFSTNSAGPSLLLWETATGNPLPSIPVHTDILGPVAFSPDGHSILIAGSDMKNDPAGGLFEFDTAATLSLVNLSTGQPIRTYDGISSPIQSLAFSPDGSSIFIGCLDGTTFHRETATGRHLPSFAGHAQPVLAAAFSPDGHSFVTAGQDKTARLWDTATGQPIQALSGHTAPIRSIAFSPDSRTLLTGSEDKSARLWDLATGKQLQTFAGHQQDGVWSVAFAPDGRSVLTGGGSVNFQGNDYATRLWDTATGQLQKILRASYGESLQSVAISPDGRKALVGYQYESNVSGAFAAILWDLQTGQRLPSSPNVRAEAVSAVAFSPDGRTILTAAAQFNALNNGKKLALWDAATGQEISAFDPQTGWGGPLTFSPDGRAILTATANGAALLDSATGRLIRSFIAGSVTSAVAFSPDGRFLLTASLDTTARLWETATGRQLATLLSFENNGWAVTDAEGRYDSNNPDNTPGLIWVTDSLRPIELSQLEDNYYTPNLLARILKGERLPAVKGLDLIPPPPQVVIANPYDPVRRQLLLAIQNQGGGVGRLVVSVNGRKAAEIPHPILTAGKLSVDLTSATLIPGQNTVSVYAFDAANQIRSPEAAATFQIPAPSTASSRKGVIPEPSDSPAAAIKPKFYAILIGVARYANHSLDLVYPAHDAESIATGLQIGAGKLFGTENTHIRLLTTNASDPASLPTKQNITAAFDDVRRSATSSDVLLVYLSGHGVNLRSEKDSYYYLTTDARSLDLENNPALRQLSTLSGAELRQWLGAQGMPLKEVLIMDTCAAGAANEELVKLVEKRDVPPDQRRAIEFLKDSTGTIILMGSAADKSSYEATRYSQGLLTYALLQGMKGRSIEDGSRLNVTHWFQNASEDVPQLAQSIGGIQKPVIAMPAGAGFPVALLLPSDQAKIPLAAVKPELVQLRCHDQDDNDPLNLEAAVREQLRDISHPSVRGNPTETGTNPDANPDPAIVYFDMIDGPPDSLTPKIVYTVTGTTITLRLRIDQSGKTVKEDHLTLSTTDKSALARAIATRLAALAAQIPTTPP